MLLLGILALLAGMVLGQRFNVLTLILANFLGPFRCRRRWRGASRWRVANYRCRSAHDCLLAVGLPIRTRHPALTIVGTCTPIARG